MSQAKMTVPRTMDIKTMLNIILIIFIVVAGFFVYYYLQQTPPDVVDANIPVKASAPPHFVFNLGDARPDRPGSLSKPLAVDVDDKGRVFIADTDGGAVKVFSPKGRFLYKLDSRGKGPALLGPAGIAVWKDRVYVTDGNNFRVLEYKTDGDYVRTFIDKSLGKKIGAFIPVGVDTSDNGDVYITDVFYQRVLVFDRNGKLKFQFGAPGQKPGDFQYANDLVVGPKGYIYVSDSNNSRVEVFDPRGKFLYELGTADGAKPDMALPRGIDTDKLGRVYVVDTFQHKVQVYDGKDRGKLLFTFGGKGTDNGMFDYPNGIAVKGNRFFVTDRENNRISVFSY